MELRMFKGVRDILAFNLIQAQSIKLNIMIIDDFVQCDLFFDLAFKSNYL